MNRKGRRSIPDRGVLEYVPEPMHHIQSRLSVDEASHTSILSKSWLHAWSTIPNLRFHVPKEQEEKERKHMKLVDVEHTLKSYLDNNIPIESFELSISIENQESASLAEKWIRRVSTKRENDLQAQRITLDEGSTGLEIIHVPNLHVMGCNVRMNRMSRRFGPLIKDHSISLGSSITDLTLGGGMIRDNGSLDMIIKLGLPFLESLTLDMDYWMLGSFRFTCASIKQFSLLSCPCTLGDVVYVTAPKLLFFSFYGNTMPSLLFPDSTLEQIDFRLGLDIDRVDASFFLKMREALMLSSKSSKLHKTTFNHDRPLPLEIDIDDLRTRQPFPPATNLQKLSFETIGDDCLWECSLFFQAFFEICHLKQVTSWPVTMLKDKNHFCELMLQVLEKNSSKITTTTYWPRYLKNVQIERPGHNPKWETLSVSHTSFLQGPTPKHLPFKFILN
ncbi:unnamed protein product [Lactuca saligna]|uniref:Uncharacterized protein n=1 Tax=Lactuca saligna TaxID=75948 RepID=A0AA35Y2J8_LACSI|nr:unnamed protein product [Lactuca saligna]